MALAYIFPLGTEVRAMRSSHAQQPCQHARAATMHVCADAAWSRRPLRAAAKPCFRVRADGSMNGSMTAVPRLPPLLLPDGPLACCLVRVKSSYLPMQPT